MAVEPIGGVQTVDNWRIAKQLIARAHDVESHGASIYRARAYRRAAETVQKLECPLAAIYAVNGLEGLEQLPTIGRHIARRIEKLLIESDTVAVR
jgi:DNA polymerase/3'-5' exonuclease PolX